MFTMDLPNLFSAEAKSPFVIALLITDASVQVSLWKVDQGRVVVVETSDIHDYTDEKTCLIETDKALQELGPDSEHVNEVVFGFEPWWVTEAGLRDERKPLLKKVTQELSLKAVGYVVITEAFAQYLRSEDPLVSAVCVYFSESSIALTLIRQGKVIQTEVVGRSGDSVADVVEALARFQVQKHNTHFPAKMVLLSHTLSVDELESEQQTLLTRTWTEDKTFLHAPVIELAPENSLMQVVTEQGGRAVAEAQGLVAPSANSNTLPPVSTEGPTDAEVSKTKTEAEAGSPRSQPTSMASSDFGFTEVTGEETDSSIEDQELAIDDSLANVAIVSDELGPEITQAKSFGVPIPPTRVTTETAVDTTSDELPQAPRSTSTKTAWSQWSSGKKYSLQDIKKFALIGFGTGVVALLIIGYFGLTAMAIALVDIQLASKPVNKQVNITLDPSVTTSDADQLQLAAKTVTKEITVSGSVPVTGTKAVGEKAKGKVTLFNKTTSPKNFAAGTTLTAGALQFTLDQAVTVASASVSQTSGGEGETKTYGKAEVDVTAAKIGTESNIAKDTSLVVATFDTSTYAAEAATAFAGGTSREVTVVSEKDRQTVLSKVQAEAKKMAEEQFKADSSNGTYYASTGVLKTITAEYSAKVGDEATELTLNLTTQAQALSYQTQDLIPLAATALADQVPTGYALSTETPQVLSQPVEAASGSAKTIISANISSKAIPQLKDDDIKNSLKGLPLKQAQAELVERPEIETATIDLSPGISAWVVRSLPTDSNRIRTRIRP